MAFNKMFLFALFSITNFYVINALGTTVTKLPTDSEQSCTDLQLSQLPKCYYEPKVEQILQQDEIEWPFIVLNETAETLTGACKSYFEYYGCSYLLLKNSKCKPLTDRLLFSVFGFLCNATTGEIMKKHQGCLQQLKSSEGATSCRMFYQTKLTYDLSICEAREVFYQCLKVQNPLSECSAESYEFFDQYFSNLIEYVYKVDCSDRNKMMETSGIPEPNPEPELTSTSTIVSTDAQPELTIDISTIKPGVPFTKVINTSSSKGLSLSELIKTFTSNIIGGRSTTLNVGTNAPSTAMTMVPPITESPLLSKYNNASNAKYFATCVGSLGSSRSLTLPNNFVPFDTVNVATIEECESQCYGHLWCLSARYFQVPSGDIHMCDLGSLPAYYCKNDPEAANVTVLTTYYLSCLLCS